MSGWLWVPYWHYTKIAGAHIISISDPEKYLFLHPALLLHRILPHNLLIILIFCEFF